jgi:cation:H+ antiporter
MTSALGMLLLGLFLLVLAGDSVIRGASGLAQHFGLSPFAAGLLLIALATSVPGLAVNVYATAVGQGELALGNAIGGNIVNIGLALGLASMIAPLQVNMRVLAAEIVFILVAAGMVLLFALDGRIARWEGGVLLAGFIAVLVFVFRRGREESGDVQKEMAAFALTSTGLTQNLIRFAFAAALLFFGSRLVVNGAPAIGAAMGMGLMQTGLIVVAVGMALPVLVTASLAAFNGQGNVVLGQVLGTCLFNLLFVVGGMAAWRPLSVPSALMTLQLAATMAFVMLLTPVLGGSFRISRRGGALFLLAFAAWLVFEFFSAVR